MKTKSVGHYLLGKTIGEGTFGRVKLGTHILTDETVAVKVLEKVKIADVADVERVARELHILKLVGHPHVIQLYEIIETPHQLYLIMEYCSKGELFDLIVEMGRVPELEACRFFHQIIAGVAHLHRLGVGHRDLKPENLLLDGHRNVKIVDFGLSNTFRGGQLLQTACGSPCYAAPEMIAGHRYNPEACDVWSCGVILFALVCGYLPFEDPNQSELYRQILSATYELPDFVSPAFQDLVGQVLSKDPKRRLTLQEVRDHPWCQQSPEAALGAPEGDTCQMTLEEDVLQQLIRLGLPLDYAEKCLRMRKHNHATTTYHLLIQKKRRASSRSKLADAKAADNASGDECWKAFDAELPAADADRAGGVPAAENVPPRNNPQICMSGDKPPHVPSGKASPSQRSRRVASPVNSKAGKPATPPSPSGQHRGDLSHASSASQRQRSPTTVCTAVTPPPAVLPPNTARAASPPAPSPSQRVPASSQRVGSSSPMVSAGAAIVSGTGAGRLSPRRAATLSEPVGRGASPPPQMRQLSCVSATSRAASPRSAPPVACISTQPRSPKAASRATSPRAVPVTTCATPQPKSSRGTPTVPTPASHLGDSERSAGSAMTEPQQQQHRKTPGAPMLASARGASCRVGSARAVPKSARGTSEEGLGTSRGSYAIRRSSRPPEQIMEEIHRTLKQMRVGFKQASPMLLRCELKGVRFDVQVSPYGQADLTHMVKLQRMTGELGTYREVCAKFFAEMQL
mmetsp:Transcript_5785/g.14063  ORF Transcript_5785/g.14063 Transcript_5785/m.14063 type:complete len:742 (-) Transcript_5785:127-2352(-)